RPRLLVRPCGQSGTRPRRSYLGYLKMKPLHFALVLSCVAGFAALSSCSRQSPATSASASDVDYYTCTMHPSVHSHDPDAKCPICGMDLVPVKKIDAALTTDEAKTM